MASRALAHAQPRPTRARARRGAWSWCLVGIAVVFVVPGLLGHPVLSFVASESMVPTLHVGDVFFVDVLVHEPRVGDIVVYQSVLKGMPAVHRVVGMQDGALLTKGDANIGTDQAAGEPPVTPDRVLGTPLMAGGAVLVLPGAALPVMQLGVAYRQVELWSGSTSQLLAYAALGASVLLLLWPRTSTRRAEGPRRPGRARLERTMHRALPQGVLGRHVAVLVILGLACTTLYAASAAREDVMLEMVVAPGAPPDQDRSAAPGQDVHRDLAIQGMAFLPSVVIVEPEARVALDATAPQLVAPGASFPVRVAERAGSEPGLQHDAVRVWRYPAFLPPEAMVALHRTWPGSPAMLLGGALALTTGAWSLGTGMGPTPARVLLGPRRREAHP